MDGAQVGVFEESYKVGLGSFLEGHDGRGLEAEVSLEVLGDFTDKTLEGEFADEELSALLVTADLTESHGTGPVPVGFLDTSCSRGGLASCLGGELLAWGLASGGLAGGLLGTSHGELVNFRKFSRFFIGQATWTRLLIGESGRPIVEVKIVNVRRSLI